MPDEKPMTLLRAKLLGWTVECSDHTNRWFVFRSETKTTFDQRVDGYPTLHAALRALALYLGEPD
jgi:hypothetical protein